MDSIRKFRSRPDSQDIRLLHANGASMPFSDSAFDLVLWALHGLDYLDETGRRAALKESERVLGPQGRLVFCTANPIGAILSPRAPTNRWYLRWRGRQLARLGFLRRSMIDLNGLRLYQALPWKVIRFVEEATDLEFLYAINKRARSRNLFLLGLFCAGPYYVFQRKQSHRGQMEREEPAFAGQSPAYPKTKSAARIGSSRRSS